jgi:hypothetical protein
VIWTKGPFVSIESQTIKTAGHCRSETTLRVVLRIALLKWTLQYIRLIRIRFEIKGCGLVSSEFSERTIEYVRMVPDSRVTISVPDGLAGLLDRRQQERSRRKI